MPSAKRQVPSAKCYDKAILCPSSSISCRSDHLPMLSCAEATKHVAIVYPTDLTSMLSYVISKMPARKGPFSQRWEQEWSPQHEMAASTGPLRMRWVMKGTFAHETLVLACALHQPRAAPTARESPQLYITTYLQIP